MSPWVAFGVLIGFGVLVVVVSFLGYRERVRWYEDYDRRNPGVAERLGVKPRVKKERK